MQQTGSAGEHDGSLSAAANAASTWLRLRAVATTLAPAARAWRAIAYPSPRAAPVMIATRPSSAPPIIAPLVAVDSRADARSGTHRRYLLAGGELGIS